ncbi:MAG: hypothetical protein NW208_00050 [Bryobacter sp.]|nr:hypothetical protein [Bryobacter sp.]
MNMKIKFAQPCVFMRWEPSSLRLMNFCNWLIASVNRYEQHRACAQLPGPVVLAFLATLLMAVGSSAEILHVCKSGCLYTTVQSALNDVADGDTVEIEAGQVFDESLRPPAKRGILIRTSRWRELPPPEQRIDPKQHADMLAIIRSPSRSSTAMSIGQEESVIATNGIDINANTIQFQSAFGLGEGVAVACTGEQLPIPLTAGEKVFLRDWSQETKSGRLALSPDGPPIDLLSNGSAGSSNFYALPRCTAWDSASDWTFRGMRFETTKVAGSSPISWLVNVGSNQQPSRHMGPNDIKFQQTVFSGDPDDINGPSFCLVLGAGRGHQVTSSWIGHCKSVGGVESKGIWLQNTEDIDIFNNYVSAASINILTAGGDSARKDVVRHLTIRQNLIEKPGYMMYKSGSGEPIGECYYGGGSGAFYRRTDINPNTCENGACYECQENGTWQLNTEATYLPTNYLTKNLVELKDCEDCVIEGNLLRGSYIGPDAGQGACISVTSGTGTGFGSGYHRNHNVLVKNNWCDQVYGGLSASNGLISGPGFDQVPLRNIVFENNLISNFARWPALSQWPAANSVRIRNLVLSRGAVGIKVAKNTFRPSPGAIARNGVLFSPGAWPEANIIQDFEMRDNLFAFDGSTNQCAFCISFPPAEANNCSSNGFFLWVPDTTEKRIKRNLFYGGNFVNGNDFIQQSGCTSRMFESNLFASSVSAPDFVSSSNHRLKASSPYNAENGTPTLLATDGTSLGADIDVVEMFAKPAEHGQPPMPKQLAVSIESGTTEAVVRFRRPGEQACSVRLYTDSARIATNLAPDTQDASRQADNRASSIVEGSEVQFLLGAEAALTPGTRYQYHIDCGELWAIGWLKTQDSQQAAKVDLVYEAANSGDMAIVEYSATPDFSSPQSLAPISSVNGRLAITMPIGSGARYVRYRISNESGQTIRRSKIIVQPHL